MPPARDINEIGEFVWRPLWDELHGVNGETVLNGRRKRVPVVQFSSPLLIEKLNSTLAVIPRYDTI